MALIDGLSGVTGAWSAARKLLTAYSANSGAFYENISGDAQTWYDQSGSSRNFTAGTSARPTASTAGPNSRACLDFDGTIDQMDAAAISNFITASDGYFIATFITDRTSTNNVNIYDNDPIFDDNNAYIGVHIKNGSIYSFNWDGTGDFSAGTAISTGTTYVVEWWHTGGNLNFRLNGGTTQTVASGNTQNLTFSLRIGRVRASGSGFFDGKLFELVAFNTVPASGTRDALVADMTAYYITASGPQTLTPDIVTDTDAFYAPPTILGGALISGGQKYWFNGLPYPVVNNANDPGSLKFWFNGLPISGTAAGGGVRPNLLNDQDTFYAPVADYRSVPAAYTDPDSFFAPSVTQRPFYVAAGTTYAGPNATLPGPVALPSPRLNGDLLVCFVENNGSTTIFTWPAGWKEAGKNITGKRIAWGWCIVDGTETAPTITCNLPGNTTARVYQFRGVDPVYAFGPVTINTSLSNSPTWSNGSITNLEPYSLAVTVFVDPTTGMVPDTPAGWTFRAGANSLYGGQYLYDQTTLTNVSDTSTAIVSVPINASVTYSVVTLALQSTGGHVSTTLAPTACYTDPDTFFAPSISKCPVLVNWGAFVQITATSITPALPTGRRTGNLLVAYARTVATGTWNVPSGWTLVTSDNQGGFGPAIVVQHWVDGSETAPTFDGMNNTHNAQVFEFINVDATTPIGNSSHTHGGSSSSFSPGAVNTSALESISLSIALHAGGTASTPVGWTSKIATNGVNNISTKEIVTTGNTTGNPVTTAVVSHWAAFNIEVQSTPTGTIASQSLVAPLYDDIDNFSVPTISQTSGVPTLAPSLVIDTDNFYVPVVVLGAAPQTLTPNLYTDTDTFFAPTVTIDNRFIDVDIFYPFVSTVPVFPIWYREGDTIYATTVVARVTLLPPFVTDADTIHAPIVGVRTLLPPFVNADVSIFLPTVGKYTPVQPPLVTSAEAIFAPTVLRGSRTLLPSRVIDPDIFRSPIVGIVQIADPNPPGGDPSNLPGNLKYVSSFVMPSSGLILSMDLRASSARTVNTRMVIYRNQAGLPGALAGVTVDKTSVVSGVNNYALIAPVSVLAGETIWTGLHSDGNFSWFLTNVPNGSKWNTDTWVGGASDPFGPPNNDNKKAPIVAYYLQSSNASITIDKVIDLDVIYSPALSQISILRPPSVVEEYFYSPIVRSNWTVAPNVYDDTDVFYAPTLSGRATIRPPLVASDDVIHSPFFATFTPTVFSEPMPDDTVFYPPTLTQALVLQPQRVVDVDVFYSPQRDSSKTLSPAVVLAPDVIFAPTVSKGAATIAPPTVDSGLDIYPPEITVVGGAHVVAPPLVTDLDVFYPPSRKMNKGWRRQVYITGTEADEISIIGTIPTPELVE